MSGPTKRIVMCLDGTWNNPYRRKTRDDGRLVYRPSNPLKVCRAVTPWDGACQQISYYGIGVGAQGVYPGIANRVLRLVDSRLGGGWGAGFERNIEDALTFLVNNYQEGDSVLLFGYSRGAAQARGLARFLDWLGGITSKRDAYWLPFLFRRYVVSGGTADRESTLHQIVNGLQAPLQRVAIDFLGVWDTVMALGSRFRASRGTSVEGRSFHVGERPPQCVRHARQALAVDERRYDFRPEIWRDHHPRQSLEQRWFAGCHGNVGGGLLSDGLANLSFRWMLGEAERTGLRVDEEYIGYFRPYPQGRLYPSRTVAYRALEAARFRVGKGVRSLVGHPERANLVLDKAVIQRLDADPASHDELDLYRPENVLEHLAEQEDLGRYLEGLGLAREDRELPAAVLGEIEERRREKRSGKPTPR